MLTLKEIRRSRLYRELMKVPGMELMQIDKELQAAGVPVSLCAPGVDAAFEWLYTAQGYHFWEAVCWAWRQGSAE